MTGVLQDELEICKNAVWLDRIKVRLCAERKDPQCLQLQDHQGGIGFTKHTEVSERLAKGLSVRKGTMTMTMWFKNQRCDPYT